jgi:hypothetical protein
VLSEGSQRDLDQETAKAVIVGLRALTEMRLKAAPARREARRVLREIQAASQANLANFGVTATELPLCPNGPLSPNGNYWSTGCRDAWAVLGWSPTLRRGQDGSRPPILLCRYMLLPNHVNEMQAFALCDEYSDGELEVYQVGLVGPVLALDEPEFSPPWKLRSGDLLEAAKLTSEAD